MRIDDLNRTPLTHSAEKPDQKNSIEEGTDQADVSQLAKALAPRYPARLEQLRLEVQAGQYQAPAEAIAKSIIDAHFKE
jgi:anti-sigma28 factor (negative regulator of flagellin synthesis)